MFNDRSSLLSHLSTRRSGKPRDLVAPGQLAVSTSNRNFEGRQGAGGRTHLVSPAVAAATAVRGTLSSPADL